MRKMAFPYLLPEWVEGMQTQCRTAAGMFSAAMLQQRWPYQLQLMVNLTLQHV